MDSHLIDYLQSGGAWLLVGSGPSTEMGYPDWEELAENTLNTLKGECVGVDFSGADEALRKKDFPGVFQEDRSFSRRVENCGWPENKTDNKWLSTSC